MKPAQYAYALVHSETGIIRLDSIRETRSQVREHVLFGTLEYMVERIKMRSQHE